MLRPAVTTAIQMNADMKTKGFVDVESTVIFIEPITRIAKGNRRHC